MGICTGKGRQIEPEIGVVPEGFALAGDFEDVNSVLLQERQARGGYGMNGQSPPDDEQQFADIATTVITPNTFVKANMPLNR